LLKPETDWRAAHSACSLNMCSYGMGATAIYIPPPRQRSSEPSATSFRSTKHN